MESWVLFPFYVYHKKKTTSRKNLYFSQLKRCWEPPCSPRVRPGCQGNFGGRIKGANYRFTLQDGTWDFPGDAIADRGSYFDDRGTTLFFSSCHGILELQRGIQASSCVGPGKSNHPFELGGRAGDCTWVNAGQKRPHLGLFPGPSFPLQGRHGSRDPIPDSPK